MSVHTATSARTHLSHISRASHLSMATHRAWRLRHRPVGQLKDTDLELVTEAKPAPGDGQLLVKNRWASIDPTHRIWMSDKPQYMDPVGLGDVMRAVTVGVVEQSNSSEYAVGDHVLGFGGLCEYYVGIPNVNVMYKAGHTAGLPVTADLSLCSIIIGLTAWYGVNKVLDVKADDVVVVSGAAGAVGSIVCQLAKMRGAKVAGIAGSADKCAWLAKDLGLDAAINYKTDDVAAKLKDFAPDGITCYFDNVGGKITDDVLLSFRNNGRVAVCGSISEYDDAWAGQRNWNMILMRRLAIKGFICTDHISTHLGEAKAELAKLAVEGKLKYEEDIREGLEMYPETVRMLLNGSNTGKLILRIA